MGKIVIAALLGASAIPAQAQQAAAKSSEAGTITDDQFGRYIAECKADFEKTDADLKRRLRGENQPPLSKRWKRLPASEQQNARVICAAWHSGVLYWVGQTITSMAH